MNQDINNIDKENDGLQDEWLTKNLNFTQIAPPLDFTQKVMEQIEVKPNPLSDSPIFWILAAIPGVIILWLALYSIGSLNISYLDFVPKVTNMISIYALSKYLLMITFCGLFFIGMDYFISKRLSHRESFFSSLMI
ncbi:MAG: hypothetical protein EHM93_19305 [Bacteroidales bacterium]|nr:MAG: hypothetical protein EHM93_19305 [Bacteroidales bacterium]